MQVESFFEWLGQALGSVIRFIVDGLSGLFNLLSNAGSNFVEGLSRTLGMDTSIISIRESPTTKLLPALLNRLNNAGSNFVEGLSRTLGMDTSIISILALIVGLILLWSAIRAFMSASIIMGIIWLLLGLWLLSWIIH